MSFILFEEQKINNASHRVLCVDERFLYVEIMSLVDVESWARDAAPLRQSTKAKAHSAERREHNRTVWSSS